MHVHRYRGGTAAGHLILVKLLLLLLLEKQSLLNCYLILKIRYALLSLSYLYVELRLKGRILAGCTRL